MDLCGKRWIMIKNIVKSALILSLCSVIGYAFYLAGFSEANIIMVYILGVLVNAVWTNGRIYSAVFSLFSVGVFNLLFTEPRFTLLAHDASYPVTFLIMLLAGVLTSSIVISKEQYRKQKQEAEIIAKQESLRANLLRTISHDLRTPLTSISGNAGILLENAEVLDEKKRKELYQDIYDDSMWLANLVENLLSVTRFENGTMQLKMEPELLEEVFHEALQHLDKKAAQHKIETRLQDDLMMAKMDVRLIIQVIVNIVNNAIMYTPENSNIMIEAKQLEDKIVIKVSDNGEGIRDEMKERIFDMFVTENNIRGDGRRGLGLGLALCKAIVAAHGGKIWVEDNEPHGAVFCFSLKSVEVNSVE